jgi:hypothetical protein
MLDASGTWDDAAKELRAVIESADDNRQEVETCSMALQLSTQQVICQYLACLLCGAQDSNP